MNMRTIYFFVQILLLSFAVDNVVANDEVGWDPLSLLPTHRFSTRNYTESVHLWLSDRIHATGLTTATTRRQPREGPHQTSQLPPLRDSNESRVFTDDIQPSPSTRRPSTDSELMETEGPSPIAYRYYARATNRNLASGSVPFILLGPNVDHWKVTAQELSARGFSVIACERVSKKEDDDAAEDSAGLVVELLDALRWSKAVLVASDGETLLAVKAALQLAPERIVGVVLCGSLKTLENYLSYGQIVSRKNEGSFVVDRFLKQNLDCPFTIVWDSSTGMEISSESSEEISERSHIIGGGSAPHRRRPKIFAWILTRFVEERIASSINAMTRTATRIESKPSKEEDRFRFPFELEDFFSPGSMVVFGRVVATALFYGMLMKVAIYQYENFREGVESLTSLRQNVFRFISSIFGALGSIFSFWKKAPDTQDGGNLGVVRERDELIAHENPELMSNTTHFEGTDKEDERDDNDSEDTEKFDIPYYRPMFYLDRVIA